MPVTLEYKSKDFPPAITFSGDWGSGLLESFREHADEFPGSIKVGNFLFNRITVEDMKE
jgi:hypothetical protein